MKNWKNWAKAAGIRAGTGQDFVSADQRGRPAGGEIMENEPKKDCPLTLDELRQMDWEPVYIEREALLSDINAAMENGGMGYVVGQTLKRYVKRQPAADVAQVVRCRECKHCDPENYHCDHHMGTAAPLRREHDDFCSYGEQKEGAE